MEYFKIILIVFGAILGAAFGSFACCQAWRIRLKETNKKDPGKRSVCLGCGKKLSWYENIPIVSWLIQGGKCRKCEKKIGYAEIMAEILGLLSFGIIISSFMSTSFSDANTITESLGRREIPALVALLATMVGLLILTVYDAKWQEMPVSILIYTVVMSAVYAIASCYAKSFVLVSNCPDGVICAAEAATEEFSFGLFGVNLLSYVWSTAILAGIYYLLYLFSHEKLVGAGDWILCIAIGLLLGSWQLVLVELFLANFLGSVVMLSRRKKKMSFGPFLVVACVIILAFSDWILRFLTIG